MDFAHVSKSLSNEIVQVVTADCNRACFSDSGVPDSQCVKNCSYKQAQLIKIFNDTIMKELPKLQDMSQI